MRNSKTIAICESQCARAERKRGRASSGEFAIERMPECRLARQLEAISAVIIS